MCIFQPIRLRPFPLLGYRIEVRETVDGETELPESEVLNFNLDADTTRFTIAGLAHTTVWNITLMVVSDRFFEACSDTFIQQQQEIPLSLKFEDIYNRWLPFEKIQASTKPLGHWKSLVVNRVTPNSLTLKWASVNQNHVTELEKQVLRFNEFSEVSGGPSSRFFDAVTLDPKVRCFQLQNLEPATIYQINLEGFKIIPWKIFGKREKFVFLVTRKRDDGEQKEKQFNEVQIYDMLLVRTPAPIRSSDLLITGYNSDSIRVAWAKPCCHKNQDDTFATKVIHRDLKGHSAALFQTVSQIVKLVFLEYRVFINGKGYKPVEAVQQNAILTKCHPGQTYHLVLATITSTYHHFRVKLINFSISPFVHNFLNL